MIREQAVYFHITWIWSTLSEYAQKYMAWNQKVWWEVPILLIHIMGQITLKEQELFL